MCKAIYIIWKRLNKQEKAYLKFGLFIILLFGFISIVILPWLLTREWLSFVDYKQTGAIGDTINGIAGPFIALLAAILTFLAFYIQYKANLEQRTQFNKAFKKQEEDQKEQREQFDKTFNIQLQERKEQERIWKIERFENQFYEMLRLHKENVNEITLNLISIYFTGQEKSRSETRINGREVFKYLIEEINILYYIAKYSYKNSNPNILINKAYSIFFHGLKPENYTEGMKTSGEEFMLFINTLAEIKLMHMNTDYKNLNNIIKVKIGYTKAYNLNFKIGEGHSSYLAHYYRHLYQTVKYIANQPEDFISYEEKRKYLRILRAQLSNEEQAILFYNWKSNFGETWENKENRFFTDYRIIHNLYNDLLIEDFDLGEIFNLSPKFYKCLKYKEDDVLFEFQNW